MGGRANYRSRKTAESEGSEAAREVGTKGSHTSYGGDAESHLPSRNPDGTFIKDSEAAREAGIKEGHHNHAGSKARWTIEINPNLIYAFTENGSYYQKNLGRAFTMYISNLVYGFQHCLNKNGEDGKSELNSEDFNHKVTLESDDTGHIDYCGCNIKNGNLRLLFQGESFMVNVGSLALLLDRTMNEASRATRGTREVAGTAPGAAQPANVPRMSLKARQSVNQFEKHSRRNERKLGEEGEVGSSAYYYFGSSVPVIRGNKFKGDGLWIEGFLEIVPEEIILKVVDQVDENYGIVLVDYAAEIYTTAKRWGLDADSSCNSFMLLL
ncbi:hypothetical protein K432DRAFT_421226 [Lepidopterella palustris CBS 459.81]|uniref:Uncharacterized protein n=1 Tax=Lepidopterella palustris CBS 459.81 TaxID=1314670 RepID=A0A8E2ELX5_9PEZI|nr:hypothetical protein K432DRAFT_421226 [Lepidopterella palustris CBS 459.81]